MSAFWRYYYWTILISFPILALAIPGAYQFSDEAGSGAAIVAGNWLVLTGLLNETVRMFLIRVSVASLHIGCFGGIIAVFAISTVIALGIIIAPVYLWVDAAIHLSRGRYT